MLRILLLEELQSEIRLIESILIDSQMTYESKSVKSEGEFIRCVNNYNPDVIISGTDFNKYSVHDALKYLQEQNKLIPFILIANNIADEVAREYVKKGVDDYVNKFNILSLPVVITRAIENKKIARQNSLLGERARYKEQKFNQYFENNNDLIIEFGVRTEILSINPATEKSIGIKLKLDKKIKLNELVYHEDLKKFKELHSSAFRGHKKDIVVRLQWKKNQVTLDGRLLPVYNQENEISSVMLIGNDITEQLNKEKELLETKSSYEALFEAINDAVCIFDDEMRLTSFNSYMSDLISKALNVKLKKGMSVEDFMPHPLLYNKWKERFARVLNGETITVEDSIEINGEIIYSYISCYPFKASGNQFNILFISKNITPFKKAENLLRKSEHQFRILSESSPVGIFQTDRNGSCEYANKKCQEMTGLSQQDLIGLGWVKAVHPEDKERVLESWKESMARNEAISLKYRLINVKNGNTVWVHGNVISIKKPASGMIDSYVGTLTDITPLVISKRIEEENKLLLSTAEEAAKIGFWVVDLANERRNFWSEGIFAIFEMDPLKGIPSSEEYLSLVHPNDLEILKDKLHRLFKNGEPFKQEFRLVFSPDHEKRILGIGKAVFDNNGKVNKVIGTIMDISEINKHKSKNSENNYLLQYAYDMAGLGTWEYDVLNEKGAWSREMKMLLGIDVDTDTPPFETYVECLLPEYRQPMFDFMRNQIENGTTGTFEYKINLSGNIHKLISLSHAVTDEQGKVIKLIGFVMDVTDKELKQREKMEYDQIMKEIFENSPDAMYVEDIDGNILNANIKAAQDHGIELNELIGKNVLDLNPGEYHTTIKNNHKKLFNEEIDCINSFTISSNGKKKPVQIKAKKITYSGVSALLLCVREVIKPN